VACAICPSCGGNKRLVVWDLNDHEGGGSHQTGHQLAFLRDRGASIMRLGLHFSADHDP
jgi:hypothetical protein